MFTPNTAVNSYETADRQKQEFRTYLESTGVLQQLTRTLVGLYEEPDRPPNAVNYIKKYLGSPTGVDIEHLRAENDQLRVQNETLREKVEELVRELNELNDNKGGGGGGEVIQGEGMMGGNVDDVGGGGSVRGKEA
eukprot:GHVQ01006711.1.p1 GENE.GHVQ01006711.1~~GHVQ01006711.1.p1  ORF type:complete len:136 (-),score=34.40 GHVQ01006711.1:783-1190(-)